MKILKIRFENIHSLKGEHEINFAEGVLGEAGLFAITGPTGSGKSTLLDIITLAIYNRIARVDKAISNSVLEDDGGVMTRNMRSCYAEVEYRVNNKDYRSHWSIERNKNNNLNNRKQELVEISSGTIIESGTNTPKKNEEIIGLTYEQFVKAMVLSQGEFSKLIQAPRNERNKLLEDITGARSYREIGRSVFQRFSGLKEKVKLKEAGLETLEVLPQEIVKEKTQELNLMISSKPDIEFAYQKASEKINIRQELLRKLEAQKLLEKNKQILKEHFDRFKEDKIKLEQHEKLSKYSPDLREYENLQKEIEKIAQQTINLAQQKGDEEVLQKSHLEIASKLVGEKIEINNANDKLEIFRSKIAALQAKENTRKGEAVLHHSQLKEYKRNITPLGYDFPNSDNPADFKKKLQSLRGEIHAVIKASGLNTMNELEIHLEKLRKAKETALELVNKKEQSLKLQKNLDSIKNSLKTGEEEILKDFNFIKSLKKEILFLEKEVAEKASILEHQKKHQSLETHRSQLEPDVPCPLCGSLEHPYALNIPYFDVNEKLLKENEKLLKIKTDLVIGHQQKVKFQSDANEKSKKDIELLNSELNLANTEINNLCSQLKWDNEWDLENLSNEKLQINDKIQALERSKNAFQSIPLIENIEKTATLWEQSLGEFENIKTERSKLYSGLSIDQDTNILSKKITLSIAHISSLTKQETDISNSLEKLSAEEKSKKNHLDSIVSKESLLSLEHLKSLILEDEIATKLRERNTKLNEGAARLSETEKTLTEELKQLTKKDDNKTPIETLNEFFDISKAKWNELSINIGKIQESLDKDAKTRVKQSLLLEELTSLKKDLALWKTMNDLIGDANGNKFSNFVQDLTLEQLIGFANKRLMEFSDRYLLDIPTAQEAEKSDTLKIFDTYMGNARRSVRTLSGGETFLVSLSMAFALSDIASRNVKIESLFIDEGFGTLDPETLDQAITILENIQNEGDKSVGIISHVSALKERITTQIKLEKGSLGYSTISIVQ